MNESKNIQFHANQLSNADRDIEAVKKLGELPMAELSIYNGSGDNTEVHIWQDLKEPLKEFLIDYFNKEKQKVYEQMGNELKSKDDE